MIRTELPVASLIAVSAPLSPAEGRDGGKPLAPSRETPGDRGFRADAIDSMLKVHSRRGEAIHASVALFRRYPRIRVVYVDVPAAGFLAPGWYSFVQISERPGNGIDPLMRGPFTSHLEARNAWLRR
jgi:hypothetical protein